MSEVVSKVASVDWSEQPRIDLEVRRLDHVLDLSAQELLGLLRCALHLVPVDMSRMFDADRVHVVARAWSWFYAWGRIAERPSTRI